MGDSLIVAPLVLAVVLAVSGVAKLRDKQGAARAFDELRVPGALARPWMRASLPWLEIALACGILLAPAPLGLVASFAALVLFAAYTVLIVRAWRAPVEATCACFGSLTSGKVTSWTVVRNVTLLVGSLATIADAALQGWVIPRLAGESTLGWIVAVVAAAWTVLVIVRDAPGSEPVAEDVPAQAHEPQYVDEPEYTRLPIPYAELKDRDGKTLPLRGLAHERAQLLIWVSPGCGSCASVTSKLVEWQELMPEVAIRPVVMGQDVVLPGMEQIADAVLVDEALRVARLFEIPATPSAVLLGADGLIAGGPLRGGDHVIELAEGMIEQLAEAREPASA